MQTHRNLLKSSILMALCLVWLSASPLWALNILLVNDDGYEAEGIHVMFTALTEAGHEVTMVAPKEDQSAKGTAIVTQAGPLVEFGGKIELVNFDAGKWYLNGTPVDCVSAAIGIVMAKMPPDLIISGPNQGENVGFMATYSGTVGAAIRAIQNGFPAIAVSVGMDWDAYLEEKSALPTSKAYPQVCRFIVDLIEKLASEGFPRKALLPKGTGLTVNYPVMLPEGKENPLGIKYTQIDKYVTFGLAYGFNQISSEAVLPGMWPSFATNYRQGEAISPNSEGKRFTDGYITISVIDGDMNSPLRTEVFNRLKSKKLEFTQ